MKSTIVTPPVCPTNETKAKGDAPLSRQKKSIDKTQQREWLKKEVRGKERNLRQGSSS